MGPFSVSGAGFSRSSSPLAPPPLQVGQRTLRFDGPVLMGVVNVTPNSSSSGHSVDPSAAIAQGVQLWRDGAAILDVGGEATNPKAAPVSAAEEWRRIEPVLRGLAGATGAILSVDTTKAEVAARAVAAGATIVNDVSGGRFDPAMIDAVADLVRSHQVAYVASHLRGRSLAEVFSAEEQGTLTKEAVICELAEQVAALPAVVRDASIVDPGLGFGKGAGRLNLELLGAGAELVGATGRPVLIGPSRKRFLRRLLSQEGAEAASSPRAASDAPAGPLPDHAALLELDLATVGACLAAVSGGAQLLRIHAVALLRPALAVYIRK